ncbi:hypothetical protein [Pseudomonas kilonensis]|uniref:hypothetical protein n=1 Tax=Pseudomonas kilonensis TaxID=132476 RepID=UPI00209E6F20|nr:hypothetical protein [Pseudomonas kilonensis]MCP1455522.1 hypothetical protein [Pseudomonas kilonensis]
MSAPGQYLFAIAAHDRVDLLDISAPYEPFNRMARRGPPYNPALPRATQSPGHRPAAGRTCDSSGMAANSANVLKRKDSSWETCSLTAGSMPFPM